MKVNVTVEISDDARMGISMARTGQIRLASRELCREWLQAVVAPRIEETELAIDIVKKGIVDQLGTHDDATVSYE